MDADEVYVNGTQVGHTTYQYPQRRYEVPAGVLRPGKNSIVVRVTNYDGRGGFVPDKPYNLAAGGDTVDLAGDCPHHPSGPDSNRGLQVQEDDQNDREGQADPHGDPVGEAFLPGKDPARAVDGRIDQSSQGDQ